MNLSELDNMSTEIHLGENAGESKAVSSLIDLDFGIGELAVSRIPYESSWVRADESSATMVTPDVSAADGLLSAFDSISFAEGAEVMNGRVKNTIRSDAIGAICEADLPGQRTDEGQNTSTFGSSDFAKFAKPSTDRDGEPQVVDEIDKTRKSNGHLIVYTSSRRNSACITNTELNQFSRSSRNCRMFAQKDSESDLKSLQIARRRRSLFSKRARSSVWGFMGLPASKEHSVLDPISGNGKKLGRERSGQGKRNVIRGETAHKSVQKSCAPTRHITLKIKIGNQRCGVVNDSEKLNPSGESVHGLCDVMESKLGGKLPGDVLLPNENNSEKVMCSDALVLGTHLDVTGSVENRSFSTKSDLHETISHEEGDNLRASTENRCSDPGTSPDSEVINSVPEAPVYEKGLQDMRDSPVMSIEKSRLDYFKNSVPDVSFVGVSSLSLPQEKSRKGKKKDKQNQFANKVSGAEIKHNAKAHAELEPRQKMVDVSKYGDALVISTANPFMSTYSCNSVSSGVSGFPRVTTSGTPSTTLEKACIGYEGNPSGFADSTEPSNPQSYDSLLPCSDGQKSPKYSGTKGRHKSRSRVLDLPSKKGKASKKKKEKNDSVAKHQSYEDDTSGLFSGVESQMTAGNQMSSDLGETGDLSKGSTGLKNNLPFASGGLKGQHVKPRNAWVLCDECQKWRRIPATLADQIEETNCQWTCKDNTDRDFVDCSIPQEKSNSEINEELEISDASCDEDACDTLLKSNRNQSNAARFLSWSLIKSNLFLHRSRKTQTIDEVMVCHCKPPSDGKVGCGAKCLNRMLNIECVKGTCPCGELCSNQQFQRRIYSKLKWFKCGKKGFGLQALQDIYEGQFVIEYVGEVLDIRAYEARQRDYALQGHRHFYFMTLNGSEVIDACAKGNLGRFINHSCDPNCRTEKWMVNGEVCVGLFAIREIKKGEELTFDYNYVRVFGAAAKKCVCGSPNCRGYIGGDPTNSDVVVQGDSDDEYAEPVMICEDREMNDEWNDIMSHSLCERENESANELHENRYRMTKANSDDGQFVSITSHTLNQKVVVNSTSGDGYAEPSTAEWVADMPIRNKYQPDNSVGNNTASNAAFGPSDANKDTRESLNCSSATSNIESEGLISQKHSPVKLIDVPEGILNSTMPSALHFAHGLELSTTSVSSKSRPNTIESKRKLKYSTMGRKEELKKSSSLAKTHRSSSSIKKEKLKSNAMSDKGIQDVDKSNGVPHKSKTIPDVSLNNQIEAVEGKLNELLDSEGGISKRKDASRGYLKLLFLTAASGTNGHGEAIQSNRDLSMILDALLKTKSRTVLVDIINKNGLQMLHNIMKRCGKEFIKTPILRKLLKVLEYLAMREILTLEHITGGPPRPGVMSFKDSILTLTEHVDKQVHQIARNFRDRWIPRSLRKNCFMEMDDVKPHQLSSYEKLSVSSGDHWGVRGGKLSESIECCNTPKVETSTLDHSSVSGCSYGNNGTRIRKRKSRWDEPAEERMHHVKRATLLGDRQPNDIDHDAPPGFSSPCKETVVPNTSKALNGKGRDACIKHPFDIVLAESQDRFVARVPLSYGIPFSIVQQFGVLEAEPANVWSIAMGLPFHPFPPLPPCGSNKGDQPTLATKCASLSGPAEKAEDDNGACVPPHSGQKRKFTCSSDIPEVDTSVANELPDFRQDGSLGRKYYKQQKWNNSKLAPPWVRMRNGWGQSGNTRNGVQGFGNGANHFRNPYISEDFD